MLNLNVHRSQHRRPSITHALSMKKRGGGKNWCPMINTKSAKLPWDGKKPVPAFHREDRSTESFYNSSAWQKCRAIYRQSHPLCEACQAAGEIQPTEEIDHIIRAKSGGALLDFDNLMGLCKSHHSLKSQKEGKTPILIPYTLNSSDHFIPVDRRHIFKILNNR